MRWEGGEESENVEDRRGMGGRTLAAGGIGTVVLVVVGMLLGVDPRALQQIAQRVPAPQPGQAQRPPTPEEAKQLKFAKSILGFTEKVWGTEFAKMGQQYRKPQMVLFSTEVDTGCGRAPSAVGPFYCPADKKVYLDPTFFDELEQKLGGSKAEFSQAYVIAHEVGHHVQNLLGYSQRVDMIRRQGSKIDANRASVRLELQADYLAGVWAHYGQQEFNFIEPGDVDSAIKSANAIGDDRLQKRSRGFVSPEGFTHGTSAQRIKWFKAGLETGDLRRLPQFFSMDYNDL